MFSCGSSYNNIKKSFDMPMDISLEINYRDESDTPAGKTDRKPRKKQSPIYFLMYHGGWILIHRCINARRLQMHLLSDSTIPLLGISQKHLHMNKKTCTDSFTVALFTLKEQTQFISFNSILSYSMSNTGEENCKKE